MEVLGELKGFIDTQVFDKLIITGDFNVDFMHPGITGDYLMNDLELCAVDLLLCFSIGFTYEKDDGLVHSWPDYILINCHCVNDICSVKGIHSLNNFSDHVPLLIFLNLHCPSCIYAAVTLLVLVITASVF